MAKRKKDKRTNNDLQTLHSQVKIQQHEPITKLEVNSGDQEW